MPRVSRRDRRIRAAFKRRVQLYVPNPMEALEPWDDEDDATNFVDELEIEETAHEHAN